MTDYKKIGLKCGLEIHQQLKGKKLFCNCYSEISDKQEFRVVRQLRSVQGEQGKTDAAAAAEAKRQLQFVYTGAKDHNCLVDLDESPPLPMNQDALHSVLTFAKMVGAQPVDFAQTMRKIVIDGSNTTGFQRTTLVAQNGKVESSEGDVRITTVIVEEDSAQKVSDGIDTVTYSLDRLGIPLIEIGTEPDIISPTHAQEVAAHLGMLLRSTNMVRRGQGTIRQDVNVSIKGGARVEVKGAQDLRMIPTIVDEEIKRQQALIHITAEWKKQKCKVSKIYNITSVFDACESKVIRGALDTGGAVLAIKITNATGLIGHEVQTGRRFGTELSDYAKRAAGVRGIFHSDELPKYGITLDEVHNVRETLGAKEKDAFILVATSEERAQRALDAVTLRLNMSGVIKEVRNALANGTSEYLRPLPGAARMYPETDIPLTRIDTTLWESIELPELITERAKRFENKGLGGDLAMHAAKHEHYGLIDELMKECKKLKPAYVAETIVSLERELKKQHGSEEPLDPEQIRDVFKALNREKISKESVLEILSRAEKAVDILSEYELMSEADVEKAVKKILKANSDKPTNQLMGLVMKELRGKASGSIIAKIVRNYTSKK